MADNKKIAESVLQAVGGKDNVTQVTHCMTRLRFNLKDKGLPNTEEIKKLNGVLSVVETGSEYQVVIGQNVPKVYDEICKLGGFSAQAAIEENLDGPKKKLTVKSVFSSILNYISGSMVPLIPAIMCAGLCKALAAVLGPYMLGVIDETHNLYILLNLMFDGFFYFLPIMVGYTAAKKMNIPPVLGAFVGGILIAPAFMEMVNAGTPFDILGINVTMVNYSQSVMPVLLSVAFMGFVYRLLSKVMPNVLSTTFTPFITVLVTVPVSFIALAPLGTIVSNAISGGIVAFGNATGFFGTAVIGAIWSFLVMTGMHTPVVMTFILDFIQKGFLSGAALGAGCATWACWGVALGAFLRLRNREEKSTAGGFFISGIVGGIAEPTLYGICMKYGRCCIAMAIGGFVGGAYMGITNVIQYVLGGASNFMILLSYTGGSTANLVNGIIASLLSLVVAAVSTYFIGFSKDEIKK